MNETILKSQLKACIYINVSDSSTNNSNRKEGITFIHLRTGHTKLTHKHLIKKTAPPVYNYCNNHQLTVVHILHECHNTKAQKQRYGIN